MPDSAAYSHDIARFADSGLMLNLPVDLVPAGQYSYFTNSISKLEGQVQTRDGNTRICTVGVAAIPIHSIFRLNEVVSGTLGEREFGVGTGFWYAPLPAGNSPVQLTEYVVASTLFPAFPVAFDGSPLSIIPFRFDQGSPPVAWSIIANGAKMMKRTANYYEQLGLPAPTVPPTASSGGGGTLTGNYDWLYTYVNVVTNSESNPSPPMVTAGTETLQPTAFTTPDPDVGGSAVFFSPSTGIATTGASIPVGGGFDLLYSARWNPWTPSGGDVADTVTLQMFYGYSITSPAGITVELAIEYSVDGGVTWSQAFYLSPTENPGAFSSHLNVAIPPTTNLATKLEVRAWARSSATMPSFFGGDFFVGVYTIFGDQPIQTYATLTTAVSAPITLAGEFAVVCVTPPVDPQETAIRLYRRGGSLTDTYYLVSQSNVADLVQGACGVGKLEIDDDSPDAAIEASKQIEYDNDMPVSSVQVMNQTLKAIWPYDERILGCGDPGRPESVYFSKRGFGDAWPPENWVIVSDPGTEMMNGFSWNLRAWAFSRERLYTLVLNLIQGQTFTPQETECRRGLKGRFGFCVGEKGVYFISKDGWYVTVGGAETSIADDTIRPLFPTYDAPGKTVNGYEAIDMDDEDGLRLERHNGEIWFDYTGKDSATRQTIIYDERKNRFRGYTRESTTTSKNQMHYSEPGTVSRLLTGSIDAKLFEGQLAADDDGNDIDVHVRTGARDQSVPLNLKEYGNVIFDLDPGGADVGNPVTITPYVDGDAVAEAAITVTGTGRQRVALDLKQVAGELYGLNISFDIAWSASAEREPVLYQMDILYRLEPSAMKHWEVPRNSLGINGWFHVRDSYLTLRSNADVTMTFTPDNGSPQTFTIPTTSGAKEKVYIPFAANKVKLAGFTFDSDDDFRIYQPECELRAKQWVTDLGYITVPIFGAEAA